MLRRIARKVSTDRKGFHEGDDDEQNVVFSAVIGRNWEALPVPLYLYIRTTQGEVWELPLSAGTELHLSATRLDDDGWHACEFRGGEG